MTVGAGATWLRRSSKDIRILRPRERSEGGCARLALAQEVLMFTCVSGIGVKAMRRTCRPCSWRR
eukprot:5014933-Prymnesium_polylepis.1